MLIRLRAAAVAAAAAAAAAALAQQRKEPLLAVVTAHYQRKTARRCLFDHLAPSCPSHCGVKRLLKNLGTTCGSVAGEQGRI